MKNAKLVEAERLSSTSVYAFVGLLQNYVDAL